MLRAESSYYRAMRFDRGARNAYIILISLLPKLIIT